jgi:hypothetical protein
MKTYNLEMAILEERRIHAHDIAVDVALAVKVTGQSVPPFKVCGIPESKLFHWHLSSRISEAGLAEPSVFQQAPPVQNNLLANKVAPVTCLGCQDEW